MGKSFLKPKVSVVMPVYNTEKYLRECMDSVTGQTLKDMEIICMDDGSTDKSGEILDEYAAKDGRIKVIHKANAGYGQTVNAGIAESAGEYIGIVEPDDYIHREMMESLYRTAAENSLDMAASDYLWFFDDKERRVFSPHAVFDGEDLYDKVWNARTQRRILKGKFINPACLFRREFLLEKDIRHNETPGAAFQDTGFQLLALTCAERVMAVKGRFYYYRHDNPDSSIANPRNDAKTVIREYRMTADSIKARGMREFMPDLLYREYGSCRYAFDRCAPEARLECLRQIAGEFCSYREAGELDLAAFPEKWKRELGQIMESPDDFYESFLGLRDELKEKLKDCDMFAIYGMGVLGKRICEELDEETRGKLKGFCVTDTESNPERYRAWSVRSVDEYLPWKESMTVVVGVMGNAGGAIVRLLEEKGFRNIVTLDSPGAEI